MQMSNLSELQAQIEQLEKHKRLQMEDVMNLGAALGQAQVRIEQLEAQIAADTIRLDEDTSVMEEATAKIKTQRARIEQLEAALRLTRPYIEMHTFGPNGTMATVLAKIDAALAPEQEK
jgi:septal ring factor EnvC (AmiA/AmiB activator)